MLSWDGPEGSAQSDTLATPTQSKGGILSKACDYIRELRQTNQRMQETFKEAERLQVDNELLRQQVRMGALGTPGPRSQPLTHLCPVTPPDRGAEE